MLNYYNYLHSVSNKQLHEIHTICESECLSSGEYLSKNKYSVQQ